jgi:hypothetical protein
MRDIASKPSLRPVALPAIALAGALLGAGWDRFHVHTGTIVYARPAGGQPWWVPLEFAVVYVAGVLGILRWARPAPDGRSEVRLAGEALWVTAAYAATAWLHQHEALVALLLAVGLVARYRTLREVVGRGPLPAAALVVGGPLVETILVASGVFRYTHASLGKVALWLPLLYANAIPFAFRLSEAALRRWGRPAA